MPHENVRQIHVRVPGLVNKPAKNMHPFLPVAAFFSNSSHGFCLFQFFCSEWVSKPQHKHIGPLAGKGQNKLWPGSSLVCYVTVDMLPCSCQAGLKGGLKQ